MFVRLIGTLLGLTLALSATPATAAAATPSATAAVAVGSRVDPHDDGPSTGSAGSAAKCPLRYSACFWSEPDFHGKRSVLRGSRQIETFRRQAAIGSLIVNTEHTIGLGTTSPELFPVLIAFDRGEYPRIEYVEDLRVQIIVELIGSDEPALSASCVDAAGAGGAVPCGQWSERDGVTSLTVPARMAVPERIAVPHDRVREPATAPTWSVPSLPAHPIRSCRTGVHVVCMWTEPSFNGTLYALWTPFDRLLTDHLEDFRPRSLSTDGLFVTFGATEGTDNLLEALVVVGPAEDPDPRDPDGEPLFNAPVQVVLYDKPDWLEPATA